MPPSDLLPERAGQPVRVWAHISLADLLRLDGSSALQEQWTAQVRARWAAHRAQASEGGSDGGAWLDGDGAEAIACDAAMAPIVTGDLDPAALEDLVRLCVELDSHRRAGAPDTSQAWAALEQAVIGKAVDLLSGPGGLASFLRREQLGARLARPSLPLDIGYSETVPAGIRNAVMLRDQRCRWAGGCNQPASACEVHHTRHKANGGKTSVKDCVLLCPFHHQVVIHRWGWTLVLNPDGTTTAWNKDKTGTRPKSCTATDPQSGQGNRVDGPLHPQVDFPNSTPRPMPSRPPVRSVQDMSTATQGHPSGSLRVSDADRDRAIAELSEHYQAGRLTTEELEDRTGRALRARTAADLADLFTDLPRRQAPMTGGTATSAAPGAAGTAPASPAGAWPARVPVVPVAILAVVAVLALVGGHPFHIAWVPVVAIVVVRLLAGGRDRDRRRWDGRPPR